MNPARLDRAWLGTGGIALAAALAAGAPFAALDDVGAAAGAAISTVAASLLAAAILPPRLGWWRAVVCALGAIAAARAATGTGALGLALGALAIVWPEGREPARAAVPIALATISFLLSPPLGAVAFAVRLASAPSSVYAGLAGIAVALALPPWSVGGKAVLLGILAASLAFGLGRGTSERGMPPSVRRGLIDVAVILPGVGIFVALALPGRLVPAALEPSLLRALAGSIGGLLLGIVLLGFVLVASSRSEGRDKLIAWLALPWAGLLLGPGALLHVALSGVVALCVGLWFLAVRLRGSDHVSRPTGAD